MPVDKDSKSSADLSISHELVTLIRGFFATPVITAVGRLGFFEFILKQPVFSSSDFPQAANQSLLKNIFQYLERLDLLKSLQEGQYECTPLGKQIFQRLSSFLAPHSYGDYMVRLYDQLIQAPPLHQPKVDRLENILGSGRTHERYFPTAISYIRRKLKPQWIVDIGCGDGKFLGFVLQDIPEIKSIGIDLSEVSVQTTQKNLKQRFPGRTIHAFDCNGADVSTWSQKVKSFVNEESLTISMWFLLHEISERDPSRVIRFLTEVHRLFPRTPLAVCELVRQSAELLAQNRQTLVMPEYLLFHDISGQGVLSWTEYQTILKQIPYDLVMQRTFDEIGSELETPEPATFVWVLVPRPS